jgi:hypothetical protein
MPVMRNSAHMTGSASSTGTVTGRQHGQAPSRLSHLRGWMVKNEHVKAWRLGLCLLRVVVTSCILLAQPSVDCRNIVLRFNTISCAMPQSTRFQMLIVKRILRPGSPAISTKGRGCRVDLSPMLKIAEEAECNSPRVQFRDPSIQVIHYLLQKISILWPVITILGPLVSSSLCRAYMDLKCCSLPTILALKFMYASPWQVLLIYIYVGRY